MGKRRKPLTDEQKAQKARQKFKRDVESIFTNSGFQSVPIEGKHKTIEGKNIELDDCFVFANLIVFCERTVSNKNVEKHIVEKKESIDIIHRHFSEYLAFLKENFTELLDQSIPPQNWTVRFLYFSKPSIKEDDVSTQRYKEITFVSLGTFNYFLKMSKAIQKSFRFELFRYMKIKRKDLGLNQTDIVFKSSNISSTILCPEVFTNLPDGIHQVTFMMSPKDLIENSVVLRKDSWQTKEGEIYYQRLIIPQKISKTREYISKEKGTFLNNIIVSLPDGVSFKDSQNIEVPPENLSNFEKLDMTIPLYFGSMSIIDGQHRVFAYYESNKGPDETQVTKLRNTKCLLVTGIIYPSNYGETKKMRFESKLFVEINDNAKKIDKDTIIYVESIANPLLSDSISLSILRNLNNSNSAFKGLFKMSQVDEGKIPTSSIIQFALSSLVRTKSSPQDKSKGLADIWKSQSSIKEINLDNIDGYVSFCTNVLSTYFGAVKESYEKYWTLERKGDEKDSRGRPIISKLLKVLGINGFIIAFKDDLNRTGKIRSFEEYKEIFSSEKAQEIDFWSDKFELAGSKYKEFAVNKLDPLFKDFDSKGTK